MDIGETLSKSYLQHASQHWAILSLIDRASQVGIDSGHMHAQLIPNDGSAPITLRRDITLVGRKTGLCDLIIDRSSISKIHCILVKTDGLLFVRDLGSTNGTRVNGQRVTRGALLPGDVLSFSSVKYKVHLGPDLPEDAGLTGSEEPTEMIRLFDDDPEKFLESDSSQSDVRILSDSDFLNDL